MDPRAEATAEQQEKRHAEKIGTLRSFAKERVLVMSVVMNNKIVPVSPLAPGRSAIKQPSRISPVSMVQTIILTYLVVIHERARSPRS